MRIGKKSQTGRRLNKIIRQPKQEGKEKEKLIVF
jgi:hypothetical protein